MTIYHVTTPKKAKKYRETGHINKPVRGFTTLTAAMAWAIKTNRTVIYRIDVDVPIENIKCVFSADKDA